MGKDTQPQCFREFSSRSQDPYRIPLVFFSVSPHPVSNFCTSSHRVISESYPCPEVETWCLKIHLITGLCPGLLMVSLNGHNR